MSDGAAPGGAEPASTGEPAAVTETNVTAPPKQGEAAATPKPRTIDDDLEDVLKKHGGYKYKAGGKEKSVTAAADLKRMLSRVDGTDSAASEALKAKQEAEGIKSRLASLKGMKPIERAKALAELVGDERLVEEAYEEVFLSKAEKEKQAAGMTPRERELADALEKRDGELATFRRQQEQADEEQKQAEYVARVTEVGKRLEGVTVAALQKAKVAPEMAPNYIEAIAKRLDRNERLGLGLDENEIADVVMAEQETTAVGWLKGKAAPDLADVLESQGLAKSLMEEFAKRIRAKVNGGTASQVQRISGTPPPMNGEANGSVAEKLAFWRSR